jgi:hypothetical protein
MNNIKSSKDLYPEQRKKLKYINTNFNYDSLQDADKNNQLKEIKDTVISTVGMYPMTKNNQELNTPLETELRYGMHDPKKLQEMALDVGKYAPIDYKKLTDGSDVMLNAKYDKLTVLQDFDKSVKQAGQIFTFKSATRKMNLDYSEHLQPPLKTFGTGVGIIDRINDLYLGDESRVNNFDVRGYEYTREQEFEKDYFVVNREELPFPKQGIDTRYINYKNARSKHIVNK